MKKDLGAEHIIPGRVCACVCVWVCVCVCVCLHKACHAVFCFPALLISLIIIFLNLISLISRGAVSKETAVLVCVCVDGVCVLVLYTMCKSETELFLCCIFSSLFMIFFSLSSFFFFFPAVEKNPTDNIEKKSVQSMDTKQANLTRPM